MLPDFYGILGVSPAATAEEAKLAFRHLARHYHPDMRPNDPNAAEHFRLIYQAYKVLTTPEQRKRYDHARTQQQQPSRQRQFARAFTRPFNWQDWDWAAETARYSPSLELRCVISQNEIATLPTEQVVYVLSELVPVSSGQTLNSLPLNLCIAVDRSASMRGEKLAAAKNALRQLIERLDPEDILALVAFDNRPEIMVRAERHQFPHVLSSVVDRLHERGGTVIGEALEAALDQVSRFSKQQMTSHIILLTDGQTYGDEERCLELAKQARQQGISITALGIGTDWNEHLLDQIASFSEGSADYLEYASDIITAMEQRVTILRNTLATNVRLSLSLSQDAHVRQVTRIFPDIAELLDTGAPEHQWKQSSDMQFEPGQVAATPQGIGLGLLWELVLPGNITGHYQFGQLDVQYDIPSAKLTGKTISERFAVTFVEPHRFSSASMSPRVKRMVELVTAYRLQQRAQEVARNGDSKRASMLLSSAALRLQGANEHGLANDARAQAELLIKRGEMERSAMLRLHYGTKNLGQRQHEQP
ncbi:MAG TPA: VWA domain-containing protein [Ktedonobacterales bacterium]|jgi:Ca-activated chloride channel family protein